MLIAVVSDTHKVSNYIQIAKEHIKEADILIHLGDNAEDVKELTEGFIGKVYAVKGNCDLSHKYPEEQIIEIDDKRIFITHGDLYNVKLNMHRLYYKAKEVDADIALFGHTHKELLLEEEGIFFMNPGSISFPRNRGRYIGYIRIEADKKPNIYLKEIKN